MNSPEWEITLYLHEFDESWMRYALGKGSDKSIRKLLFPRFHIQYAEKSVEL